MRLGQDPFAQLPELFERRFQKKVDKAKLAASYVCGLPITKRGNGDCKRSFKVTLGKELSEDKVCPTLAHGPLSAWIDNVCNVKCLAQQEGFVSHSQILLD